MATWVDGAEYAPTERPDGFATPRTEPLSAAATALNPADNQPDHRPTDYSPAASGVPLDRLVPNAGPTRNPTVPFETAAVVSADSAWGALAASHTSRGWTPQQPLLTSAGGMLGQAQRPPTPMPAPAPAPSPAPAQPPYPAPTGVPTYPPPGGAPTYPPPGGAPMMRTPGGPPIMQPPAQHPGVQGEPRPVGLLQTTTPLVLVLLAAGFIEVISPILFAVAFAMALGTGKGRKLTIATFSVMSAVILLFGVLGLADGTSWELMSTASIGASWLTLVVVVFGGLSGNGRGNADR